MIRWTFIQYFHDLILTSERPLESTFLLLQPLSGLMVD